MRIISIDVNTKRVFTTPMCACIGYFDGVHKGHQALIQKTISLAKEYDCESALITFDPDPWVTIKGIENVQHITTMKERINRIVSFGIENIIILKFTKEMSALSADDFMNLLSGHICLKALVCGFDFHYGYQGKGNIETLKNVKNLRVEVVDAVEDTDGKISSTRIAKAIEEGNMYDAMQMLGEPYCIEGKVVHGAHQGTTIGFPTANVKYSAEYLLPKIGVYAGVAKIRGKKYGCMINLGHNPTFNYSQNASLEAHIFNFHGDLYGKNITIQFYDYIRPETKFRSKENLIMQLEQDVRSVKEVLKKYE